MFKCNRCGRRIFTDNRKWARNHFESKPCDQQDCPLSIELDAQHKSMIKFTPIQFLKALFSKSIDKKE